MSDVVNLVYQQCGTLIHPVPCTPTGQLIPDAWTADTILSGVSSLLHNGLFLNFLMIIAALVLGPRLVRMVIRLVDWENGNEPIDKPSKYYTGKKTRRTRKPKAYTGDTQPLDRRSGAERMRDELYGDDIERGRKLRKYLDGDKDNHR